MMEERKNKYGIICRVMIDHDEPDENGSHSTRVYRRDRTPERPDYRELMDNGGNAWRREHSDRNLLEWGTPTDYLGDGTKLLLYDTDAREITVVADIEPDKYFIDEENHYRIRNIIRDGSLCVLSEPIPLEEIKRVDGLQKFQNYRNFKDITEDQFMALVKGKKCTSGKIL